VGDGRSGVHRVRRLCVAGLSKHFGDIEVLHNIRFEVAPGEIHGLVGQNGSGKSTLIKVLTGVHAPDSGARIEVDGVEMKVPVRWRQIHEAGVSVVHQDFGLVDALSVADNVCVGSFPRRRGLFFIDRRERDRMVGELLQRLGVSIETNRLVGDLSAGERAVVALARAIKDHEPGKGLIILDEATRTLRGRELVGIYALLRALVKEGSSVLVISHSIDEVFTLCDRVSILRDGELTAVGWEVSSVTKEEVAYELLGGKVVTTDEVRRQRAAVVRAPVLSESSFTVEQLRGRLVDSEIDFSVQGGEILGITGLVGSGFEEIPYILTGAMRPVSGYLEMAGLRLDLRFMSPKRALDMGIVLVPERRERDGLALERTVRENMTLLAVHRMGRRAFIGLKWQDAMYEKACELLNIKSPGAEALLRQLSGGNQQKVLLGKCLMVSPKILIAHEPTQAVDIGARQDIREILKRIAEQGVAVVLVSSDIDDIVNLSNRILLYRSGEGLSQVDAGSSEELIQEVYGVFSGQEEEEVV